MTYIYITKHLDPVSCVKSYESNLDVYNIYKILGMDI